MRANARERTNPLWIILIALVILLLPVISTLDPPVFTHLSGRFVSESMPYNLAAHDTENFIPIRGFGMTERPPECRRLGIFGCTAHPSENMDGEEHIVDLTVRMGKQKLGQIQMMEIPSTYAAELEPALAYSDTVWIEYIGVRQFLWNNGFGRWLFTQGNNLLKYLAAREGQDIIVRVLIDQTGKASGWLDTIPVEDIISAAEGVYIFALYP